MRTVEMRTQTHRGDRKMKKYQARDGNGKGLAVQVIAESKTDAIQAIRDKMLGNELIQELRAWRSGGYQVIIKAI